MENKINYTIVGLFVIGLVAAAVLGIIWLSAGLSLDKYTTYMVYMQESVSGLNIDSPVEFNGVNVGTVQSVELDAKDPVLVDVELTIKSSTPVTQGTTAVLATRGITGITFIALKDKSEDLRPLVPQKGQRYAVIPTGPSIFLRLDTALNRLSQNMEKVSEAVNSLLDPENQKSIKQSLLNMERITRTLAANSDQMTLIMENTAKASRAFGPLIQASTTAMRMLESQTLPATYRLLSTLEDVSRTLSDVAVQLNQNPSILVRGTAPKPLGPGEKR